MKTHRVSTRDRRENRAERQEKLGAPGDSLPSNTLAAHEIHTRPPITPEKRSKKTEFPNSERKSGSLPAAVIVHPAADSHLLPVTFRVDALEARQVYVAGSFNDWNPSSMPLENEGGGHWRLYAVLPLGSYEYRYVIDGRWCEDPMAADFAPNPFGERNSILRVGG